MHARASRPLLSIAAAVAVACASACGGGPGTPQGPVVGSPGNPDPPPTKLVGVKVSVTIPPAAKRHGLGPDYVSANTASLVIQLASVDGSGVSGVNATTINTLPKSHGCKPQGGGTICTATATGSPGNDVFAVTTFDGTNATGDVLSVGSVSAKIGSGGGGVPITNQLSLSLAGVIASLKLALSPNEAKRGDATTSQAALNAYDASGAQIVGPSDFAAPISLTVQGDTSGAFVLHAPGAAGSQITIRKPTSGITLKYDGNRQASSVTIQASVAAPSAPSARAPFTLRGKQPPPPVGTIYALNLGSNNGLAATVTEYDGKANGNAAPVRTLQLSSKLYARSIAVDSSNNLYVGYFDTTLGFEPSTGLPDAKNEVAIYAPNASGGDQPSAVLTADKSTKTTIFPLFMTFDPSGDFVTYGATTVDNNTGNAVLTYAPGSSGAATPLHGWNFSSPSIEYAGPTGFAMDSSGNFYVNGALRTTLGPSYGLFVAAASDIGNPSASPVRTVPWDTTTQLTPGLTTLVALDSSGEPFIANSTVAGTSGSTACQGRANVFAAGASGGTTDNPPLRILVLAGILAQSPYCDSPRDPRVPFFPSIALYGTTLFVSDDFNNAIAAYPAGAKGTVKATLRIAGSATGLSAPIALVITKVSGGATARPATGSIGLPESSPAHPLDATQRSIEDTPQ